MATMSKNGYGQVEPNHLSAMRTGQIYAQLPCASSITALENGTFVKYNYGANEVQITDASGTGEWMLHMSEVKLYEPRQFAKDFVLTATDTSDGKIYPRVYKTNVGDIITTNQVVQASGYDVGDWLTINASGILVLDASPDFANQEHTWRITAITTMPDGDEAVKIQRIM